MNQILINLNIKITKKDQTLVIEMVAGEVILQIIPEQEQANEAVLALIALGYKQVDAHKLVRDLQEREGAGKSAEELVKMALKRMAAGR